MRNTRLLVATVSFGAALLVLSGCFSGAGSPKSSAAVPVTLPDGPMHRVADKYYDVAGVGTYLERSLRLAGGGPTAVAMRFHTLDQVRQKIDAWNRTYPGLVDVHVIGKSRQGRPLWEVLVTNESVPGAAKIVPILDGAHHGNEYAGAELMLYTVDTLLENAATNASVRALLREEEIHVVPIVNPDGWEAGTRYNGLGVNLNRNYDLDWGDPLGTSNPLMGRVGGATGQPLGGVALVAENCGASAFSEPETQAMRDLFKSIGNRTAVYLTGHTPSHAVIAPWAAFQAPFQVPNDQARVLESELQWIRAHTEYQAGKAAWGNLSAGLPYAASGSSMDYLYATLHKPAFTVEVEYWLASATSKDYPGRLATPFDGLRYWMDASLPISMHLLANAQQLSTWQTPTAPPLIPTLSLREHPAWPGDAPPDLQPLDLD